MHFYVNIVCIILGVIDSIVINYRFSSHILYAVFFANLRRASEAVNHARNEYAR